MLDNILSYEVVQTIGWILLHFVWQAAVVALLLAILLRLLRKSTVNLRYIIACLALTLIVLLPVITIQLLPVSAPQMAAHIEPASVSAVLPTEEMPPAETTIVEEPVQAESVTPVYSVSWKQRAIGTLEPSLPYIVSGWLVGVFGLSLWHLGGWAQLQRLKRRMVKQVDDALHSTLKVLAERLRVNRTVQLVESALVQIPTVVGWLRPVILLPASALTGLSTEQLEAILAHELAHIKRVDYLINMLQTVVEILGFYHPAVWWVSHKIRAERENCCDDLAVAVSGDRVCYAKALTSMEEIRADRGQLAVAATGGNLFRRICRLLGKDSADSSRAGWIPSAITILLIAIIAIPTTLALTGQTSDKSDKDIETTLIEGFRENRAKFKCGVLAWARKTINDGFSSSVKDKYETEGSFQLWWDGNKIATKYVDERVCSGTGRRWWIEAQTGGNAYDGSLLSRKPKFRLYENWFIEVICWIGPLPLDKDIATMKKLRYVSLDWSIIEVEGKKQIKLIIKNLKDGASGIRYFDLSRGCNQVRRESYNAQGQLCNRETRKLQQVSGGGWFPVDVDMKVFNRKDGKVELHHHFVLDLSRCSFNEPSAIPEGIFKFSTTKEQEQLNKILEKYSGGKTADENNENVKSVCESVENYIAAALAGEDEKAAAYAYPGSAVVQQTDDTREVFQDQPARIVAVCSGQWNSLAISSVIQADHGRVGPAVFHLKKEISEQKVHRLIDDIDLETLDTVEREIADFLSKNPEARTVIVKSRRPMVSPDLSASKETDVSVEDDILLGTLKVKDSSADSIPIVLPTITKSSVPSAKDKTHVQVECLIVEVSLDSKMDRETTIMAENLLGNKISLRDTKVDVLLRKAVGATAATKDKSAENKRVTEKQFNALVKMLDSKGYMKILMNPMIETLNGKTATIRSAEHVPLQQITKALPGGGGQLNQATKEIQYVDVVDSIEITPHVLADGHISLGVEANLGSQYIDIPLFEEPTTPVSLRQLSTKVRANPGESLIISYLTENPPSPGENVNNTKRQAKEVLFIITPTIMTPPAHSQKITDTQIEGFKRVLSAQNLKKLGLAVAMYADDHNDNLPESFQELKPYMRDEQFDWLVDNIEYFNKGKLAQRNAQSIPIAYDRTLPEKADGTNVLFLDFSVRFLDTKEFEKLDFKRAEILIETWFLAVNKDFIENINHNADSPDEAKELFKLKSELLAAVDGSNKSSFIPPERNLSLLLKAVRAHKDSKVLAAPKVKCLEGKTAEIKVINRETFFPTGYTEPNSPFETLQEKFDKVEEGVTLSLKPNLTTDKNIVMQFEFQISKFLDSEEHMFQGKAPYKPSKVQRNKETLIYRVQNGEAFLFGGHKIADPDPQDGQTEQKDLLILIKAHTIDSSEQDKPAKTENLIVTEPPTTTNVITQPAIAKSRTERQKDNEQEKTKPATEQQSQMFQKLFKLKHHDASQMANIVKPLLSHTGHISADERTNNLLIIDTVENLKRIEKIITEYDVPKADETVTEIFEIRYGDPAEIAKSLRTLISTQPGNGSIIEQGKEPIVLIPQPTYKWIIAKASAENIKQIGQWIKKLDIKKSTIGLDPIDEAVHEQLETIVDLSDLAPEMSFGEVVEKLENSVEPPLQIQPIWKDLLDNAEVEQATPAGMDPLTGIKLRKALEILLVGVTSSQLGEFGELTYVVDDGVILIGTVHMLPPKMVHRVYDISDLIETDADADTLIRRITEIIEPDSWYSLSNKGEGTITPYPARQPKKFAVLQTYKIHQQIKRFLDNMRSSRNEQRKTEEPERQLSQVQPEIAKLLDESEEPMTPLEQIQKQLDELIKQREAPKVTEPNLPLAPKVPLISNTFIDCPLIDALKSIAAAADVTIIPDETVVGNVACTLKDVTVETALDIVLAGTPYVWKKTPYYYLVALRVDLPEIATRMESGKKLSNLGKALLIYANDHDDKYPNSLRQLPEYFNVEDYKWVLANVEYLAHGKTLADRPVIPLAYDKTLLSKGKGTNVIYNDSHVGFEKVEELKKLRIGRRILIDTKLLSVSEGFLKTVGLDPNSIHASGPWSEHLVVKYPAEPNSEIYSLILDNLHVSFLLRALGARKDAYVLASPQVLCLEGKKADIRVMAEEYYYVKGYNEPNTPSDKPQQKLDKVEIGTQLWLKPILTPDNKNVDLDLELEITQLLGIIDGKYKGKYPYQKPIIDVISRKMPSIIPDGKTMLIGGLKIIEQIKKEPGNIIGDLFKRDTIKDQKMLLVLVKPITNPQQKATKILPGQEDSEKDIQRLAEQLDKKINPPNKPK